MKIASLSRQGGRPYNEDVFGQWNDGRFVACVVADGAGGHGGGDVAADIARTSVLAGFAAGPGLQGDRLRGLLTQANRDVVAHTRVDIDVADIETARAELQATLAAIGAPAGTEIHYTLQGKDLADVYAPPDWRQGRPVVRGRPAP